MSYIGACLALVIQEIRTLQKKKVMQIVYVA